MPGDRSIVGSATLRLGTRGSKLALCQAHMVQALLQGSNPELAVEIVTIKTSGDRGEREVLGAFVREIQEALLAGSIDVALHCLKDLPTRPVAGLTFAAYLPREDASESIITRGGSWLDLPAGSVIGTGSVRRTSQIVALRSDVAFKALVGNVDTRLRKLQEGVYDAIVLATAGLKRLGLIEAWADSEYSDLKVEPIDILPAAGQAVLVLEVKEGSSVTRIIEALNDLETEQVSTAERAFLRLFGTGCSMPIAASATIVGSFLVLDGLVSSIDGKRMLRDTESGEPVDAEHIGYMLADRLCSLGARELVTGGGL